METKELIKKRLAELPESVRRAIKNINYTTQVQSLMQKHNLRLDQAGIVDREIMLVLLGLEHPDKLFSNLMQEGGLSKDVATAIAEDLNEKIFKAIRHELVETYEKEKAVEETVDKTPTAASEKTVPMPNVSTPAPTIVPQTPVQPTAPINTLPQPNAIAKTKLEQSFHIPTQTATVSLNQTSATPAQPIRRREIDPYREPIQ